MYFIKGIVYEIGHRYKLSNIVLRTTHFDLKLKINNETTSLCHL